MPASDSDAFPDLYLRPSDELTFASLALLHHAMHHRPAVVAEGGRGVCRVLPLVVKMVRLLRSTNQSRGCFGKLPPIAIPGFILFNAFIRFNHTHKKKRENRCHILLFKYTSGRNFSNKYDCIFKVTPRRSTPRTVTAFERNS